MKLHELYPKSNEMLDEKAKRYNTDKVSNVTSEQNLKPSSVLFPEISLNPASSKDIKQWILQLAVEGKLTKKWREEKGISNEQIKLTDENQLFIPKNWKSKKIKELGKTQTGGTPSKSNPEFFGNDVPFIKPGDVNNWSVNYFNEGLSEKGKLNLGRNAPKGSILMVCLGTIGKCALIEKECCFNQQINSLTALDQNPSYLLIAMSSSYFQKEAWSKSTSTTIALLNKSNWENISLPIPPLEEQQAIVTIVEDLFKEVDALAQQATERIALKRSYAQAALKRLCEADTAKEWQQIVSVFPEIFNDKQTIKTLRETILQLAVQGKLTAKWRSKEGGFSSLEGGSKEGDKQTAHELLAQIKAEKAQLIKEKKIKAEKPLPAIEADEIPFELPEGWVWCRMGDIGLFDRGKSKHRPRNDYRLFDEGKYPLVQTGDISKAKFNNGKIISHKSTYNEFGLSQSKIWPKGTLCITIAANIAETGFLTYDACFPDSVVGFQSLVGDSLAYYVEFFIATAKADLEKYAPSTAQKNINLGILYELKFPLPPLAEQQIIFEKVNTLMGLCDELEKGVEEKNEALLKLVLGTELVVKNKNVEA